MSRIASPATTSNGAVSSDEAELPLSEIAFNRIRNDILTCRLAPGQRVTERGLVADLGMSIAAVRNAMTRLDQDGLLITRPRKGYIVAPLSLYSVDKLFDFWELLAPEIARRGVPAMTDVQLRRVLEYSTRLDAQIIPDDDEATRGNLLAAIDASLEMFTVMAEASANPYLIEAHRRIVGELGRVWRIVIQAEFDELGGRVESLREVVRHLEDRQAEKAAQFLRSHIETSRQRVLSTLIRWPSVSMSEITLD